MNITEEDTGCRNWWIDDYSTSILACVREEVSDIQCLILLREENKVFLSS